ncbi:MAG TPA: PilZ domain-containing protein [Terriglobales bacterium]|nr:PilZ domain-containing protein [Terriglobales bacterium]
MGWSALVFSRDPEVRDALAAALAEAGFTAEICPEPASAVLELARHKFDAAVLDCDAESGDYLSDLLRHMREVTLNSKLVVVSVVGNLSLLQKAFHEGASFVLSKPLAPEVTRRTLRAVSGLLHRMARRFPRKNVSSLAMVTIDGVAEKAMMMQLGEGGMGLQALEPLEVQRTLQLRFEIPGTDELVEATGDIAWADPSGRVGVRFVEMSDVSRERLRQWVMSDAVEAGAAIAQGQAFDPDSMGTLKIVPPPQRLTAALFDGLIVLAATAIFEVIVLTLTAGLPRPFMAQATALAIPCLFWSLYQYLFLRGVTPGARLAGRIALALASRHSALAAALLTPVSVLWRGMTRMGARMEMPDGFAPPPASSQVSFRPARDLERHRTDFSALETAEKIW